MPVKLTAAMCCEQLDALQDTLEASRPLNHERGPPTSYNSSATAHFDGVCILFTAYQPTPSACPSHPISHPSSHLRVAASEVATASDKVTRQDGPRDYLDNRYRDAALILANTRII